MALKYIGERAVGTLNGMRNGFVKDNLYRVFDSGILMPGGVSVNHGDFVSWDGSKWVNETDIKIATNESVSESMTNLAPEYSATSTYAAGSYVIHDGVLYTNLNAIATAEDWTPAHWTQTTVEGIVNSAKTWTEKSFTYQINAGQTQSLDVHDHEFVNVKLMRKGTGTVYLNMHLYGECYVYLDKGQSTIARTFIGASSSQQTTNLNTGLAKLNSDGTAVQFNKPSPSDSGSNTLLLHYFGGENLVVTPIP